MTKYLRIDCVSYDAGKQIPCMTGIQVTIEDEDDFETAKAKALAHIVTEFSRYGLHEALGGLGIKPASAKPTVLVNGEYYTPLARS